MRQRVGCVELSTQSPTSGFEDVGSTETAHCTALLQILEAAQALLGSGNAQSSTSKGREAWCGLASQFCASNLECEKESRRKRKRKVGSLQTRNWPQNKTRKCDIFEKKEKKGADLLGSNLGVLREFGESLEAALETAQRGVRELMPHHLVPQPAS